MTRDSIRGSSDRSILILTSLADGPKHGYALIKDIEDFAGTTLGAGTLYGALAKLERAGLVEALPASDRRRRTRSPRRAGKNCGPACCRRPGSPRWGCGGSRRSRHEPLARAQARRAVPAGLAGAVRRRGRRSHR